MSGGVNFSLYVKYDSLYPSDYPYTTVPNQVQRIFRAQQLHDRKHYDERMSMSPEQRAKLKYIDYLRPIIADGDTGYAMIKARDHVLSSLFVLH